MRQLISIIVRELRVAKRTATVRSAPNVFLIVSHHAILAEDLNLPFFTYTFLFRHFSQHSYFASIFLLVNTPIRLLLQSQRFIQRHSLCILGRRGMHFQLFLFELLPLDSFFLLISHISQFLIRRHVKTILEISAIHLQHFRILKLWKVLSFGAEDRAINQLLKKRSLFYNTLSWRSSSELTHLDGLSAMLALYLWKIRS